MLTEKGMCQKQEYSVGKIKGCFGVIRKPIHHGGLGHN
jgi:hypothetical protein